MSVHVHIEHLVLDGFAITPAERTHLQKAVEQELARMLATPRPQHAEAHPLSRAGGAVPSTTAGPFNPPRESTPTQLGHHIAQSIHGGLGKGK